MCVCVCVRACVCGGGGGWCMRARPRACVCVYVLGGEGSMVFDSTALIVVGTAMYRGPAVRMIV